MTTLTRKQREIKQRETALLDLSRRMLVEQGYAGLSMDRLAEEMEYSKGVIYTHFKSKEDLVAALAVQSLRERVQRFQRAARFQGRPRERMMAIGVAEELFVRLRPYHFHSEQIIKLGALHEKASSERLAELQIEEGECFSTVLGIVQSALAAEDLVMPRQIQPSELVFALWALHFGCYTLAFTQGEMFARHGIPSPFATVRNNCHCLLDGYGWKPLSTEWNYEATWQRIMQEVFPEEMQQLPKE